MIGEVPGRGGPDYFLSNPPRQPKKEIGDYVESQGILVPRRFESLDEALQLGKPFIIRSEHPQDYAGASNIFSSSKIGSGSQTMLERGLTNSDKGKVAYFCKLMRIPLSDFLSNKSYSYWELLPGYNRTVVADSAVPGRYHILTPNFESETGVGQDYTIVEEGRIVIGQPRNLPLELVSSVSSLIDLYESVRKLDHFDKNHCPIMEVQTLGSNHYFLQYHRGINVNLHSFTLNRGPLDGEMEAKFVRGATPKDGLVLKLNYHSSFDSNPKISDEEAGIDVDLVPPVFKEIMARKRKLVIVWANNVFDTHLLTSEIFKSQICVALSDEDLRLLGKGNACSSKKPTAQFTVRVVSDGRRAYIRRLD